MIPAQFLRQFDFELPGGYATYLFSAEKMAVNYGAFLVNAGELLQYNRDYQADEFYPGYLLIGSTGGGEALAIEKATGYFVITPFIGHDSETPVRIGQTWAEFFPCFQRGNLFDCD